MGSVSADEVADAVIYAKVPLSWDETRIRGVFSAYGTIVKYKERRDAAKAFTGSVFLTFQDAGCAAKAVNQPPLAAPGSSTSHALQVMSKAEHDRRAAAHKAAHSSGQAPSSSQKKRSRDTQLGVARTPVSEPPPPPPSAPYPSGNPPPATRQATDAAADAWNSAAFGSSSMHTAASQADHGQRPGSAAGLGTDAADGRVGLLARAPSAGTGAAGGWGPGGNGDKTWSPATRAGSTASASQLLSQDSGPASLGLLGYTNGTDKNVGQLEASLAKEKATVAALQQRLSQAQEDLRQEKHAHGVLKNSVLAKDVEINALKGEVGTLRTQLTSRVDVAASQLKERLRSQETQIQGLQEMVRVYKEQESKRQAVAVPGPKGPGLSGSPLPSHDAGPGSRDAVDDDFDLV